MSKELRHTFADRLRITYLLGGVILIVIAHLVVRAYLQTVSLGISYEVLLELPVITLLFIAIGLVWRKVKVGDAERTKLSEELYSSQLRANELCEQTNDFKRHLRQSIDKTFLEWNLTKSEREIAFLILMGKSIMDIAAHRFTSERTLRNQCRSIYEKSGLGGRHELAAHFLVEALRPSPAFAQESLEASP